MKIKFLGTAAAEGIPALWCECDICRQAKRLKGKDLRKRCSYLIGDDTIVDFGPDAFWQSCEYDIDLLKMKRLIFTHPHADHLNPLDLLWRKTPWFSRVSQPVTIIGSRPVFARIVEFLAADCGILGLEDIQCEMRMTSHGQTVIDGDMMILSADADHAPGREPLVHLISRGDKNIFIANDTGFLPEKSWQVFAGRKMDLVAIDTTCGLKLIDHPYNHQGANSVIRFRDRLLELGCIGCDTPVYANHFSHNGGALHEDLCAYLEPRGIQVAYDGLELEL